MTRASAWRGDALCANAADDLWFPHANDRETARLAKQICNACPVQTECLNEALHVPTPTGLYVQGIWGGTTPRERHRIRERQQ